MLAWVGGGAAWVARGASRGRVAVVARRTQPCLAERPGPSPFGRAAGGMARKDVGAGAPAQDSLEQPTRPRGERDASEFIRLDNFMKIHGMVDTGGQAKLEIQDGRVNVNGEVETRRGRKLRGGDVVAYDQWEEIPVEFD